MPFSIASHKITAFDLANCGRLSVLAGDHIQGLSAPPLILVFNNLKDIGYFDRHGFLRLTNKIREFNFIFMPKRKPHVNLIFPEAGTFR